MDIFEDYQSWKTENHELLSQLVKHKSACISRFIPVLAVVDYLYERNEEKKLDEDEMLFFSRGFDYIVDQFTIIDTIYEYKFKKDIVLLEAMAKSVNLLLYIKDFQGELLDVPNIDIRETEKPLDDLEDKVNECIDRHTNVPDEYFVILNETVDKIFSDNDIELHTIEEIYSEIASEYEILQNDEYDLYNDVLNKQIAKSRAN